MHIAILHIDMKRQMHKSEAFKIGLLSKNTCKKYVIYAQTLALNALAL